MILLSTAALIVIIQAALWVTSPGNREHALLALPLGKLHYLGILEDMVAAKADGLDLEVDDVAPFARLQLWAAFPARSLIAIAAGFGLAAIPGVPDWVGAILPALQVGLQEPLDRTILKVMGRLPPSPEPTRRQSIVLWVTRSAAIGVAWLAFWLAYSPVSAVRHRLGITPRPVSAFLLLVVSGLAVLLILGATSFLTRFGQRLSQRFASPQFELNADSDTILYLRSFGDDDIAIQTPLSDSGLRSLIWPRMSFEEYLSYCSRLGRGTLVTVGRPGEWLPQAGAVRSYYEEDRWREGIRLTAERAGQIILAAGATESLSWEISHLRDWGLLGKCLFVVPPLPPDTLDMRIERLLRALDVLDAEWTKVRSLATRCIVGLRMKEDRSVQWLVSPGRDWFSYVMALTAHTSHTDNDLVEGEPPSAHESASDRTSDSPSTRPIRQPPPVARVVRQTFRHWTDYSRDRNKEAMAGYQRTLEQVRSAPDADPQAVAYLMSMVIASAIDAGRTIEALDTMYALAELAPTLKWIWVLPTQVKTGDELLFDLWDLVADTEWELGRLKRREAALRQRLEAALRERDRRHQCQAACHLAVVVEQAEARTLAEGALEQASHLADPALQGRAHYLLSIALQDLGQPGWYEHGRQAAEAFEKVGETDQAALALEFVAVSARDSGDDQAGRTLLQRALALATDDELRRSITEDLAEINLPERAIGMFSPAASEVWRRTRLLASTVGTMSAGHLLIAVLEQNDPDTIDFLVCDGRDPSAILGQIRERLARHGQAPPSDGPLPLTQMVRKTLARAVTAADERHSTMVQVQDLMAGLLDVDAGDVATVLHPNSGPM